jgi:hypothetical protein
MIMLINCGMRCTWQSVIIHEQILSIIAGHHCLCKLPQEQGNSGEHGTQVIHTNAVVAKISYKDGKDKVQRSLNSRCEPSKARDK